MGKYSKFFILIGVVAFALGIGTGFFIKNSKEKRAAEAALSSVTAAIEQGDESLSDEAVLETLETPEIPAP